MQVVGKAYRLELKHLDSVLSSWFACRDVLKHARETDGTCVPERCIEDRIWYPPVQKDSSDEPMHRVI